MTAHCYACTCAQTCNHTCITSGCKGLYFLNLRIKVEMVGLIFQSFYLERTPISQRIGGWVDPTAGLNMVTKRRIAARNHDVTFSNMTIRIVQSCFVVYESPILRQYMSKYYRQKCIFCGKRDNLGITNIGPER